MSSSHNPPAGSAPADAPRHDLHGPDHKPKTVEIIVNKRPVVINDDYPTGLEIKQAAIKDKVQIDLDFQLWEEGPHGDQIDDDEHVHVHKGMRFDAIAPDDNS